MISEDELRRCQMIMMKEIADDYIRRFLKMKPEDI
jgi:hypothetical protein